MLVVCTGCAFLSSSPPVVPVIVRERAPIFPSRFTMIVICSLGGTSEPPPRPIRKDNRICHMKPNGGYINFTQREGQSCSRIRPESGRIRGKQHPASGKGYKRSRHPRVGSRTGICVLSPVKRSGRGGGGARWGRFDTRVAGADVEPRVAVVHFAGHAGSPVRKEGRGGVPHLILRPRPAGRGATGVLLPQ